MVAQQQYFYDGQIERFLTQFIRLISGFQVEFGKDSNGNITLQRVPVYFGDGSRQVASIIQNNSGGNALPPVPAMTVYISAIKYDRDRIQDPTFVGTMNLRQRIYNEDTNSYEQSGSNALSIERLMPVPYELELKVDIWTSNTKQKLQLLEQINVLFNPSMELQSTDNYVDWSSLTAVYLDSYTYTSRSIPIGPDNPVDVATITFRLPIWISAPIKVTKIGVVQKIIASMYNSDGNLDDAILNEANLLGRRQYFTPMGYGVLLIGNTLTLLKQQDTETPHEPTLSTPTKIGTKDSWHNLVNFYGVLNEGVSQVRLALDDNINELVGTVTYHPTDDSLLIFNADIDTYPTNTLTAINAIIDPRKVTVDSSITSPAAGTRYLILNDIGSFNNPVGMGPLAWQGTNGQDLVAHANDIIEFNGTNWAVSFDSQTDSTIQYVSNLNTGTQYKWNINQWVKSWEGEYKAGLWTLVI